MFKWFRKLFIDPPKDELEVEIKTAFAFLLDDYGFSFAKSELGNDVDKEGNFFFYGPLNAYYIYNNDLCINMLYLSQRQELTVYITDECKEDQVYIIHGQMIPEHLYAYGFSSLAAEIKAQLNSQGMIFGREI